MDQRDNVVPLPGPKRAAARTKGWQRWEGYKGGRYWLGEDGARTYYLRTRVRGELFQAKLVGADPVSLADQARRFWADPAGFDPRGAAPRPGVTFDVELVKEYLAWCAAAPPGRKRPRNSKRWLGKKRSYLSWWMTKIAGRDLRAPKMTLDDLKAFLRDAPNYKQCVSVIKHVYTFCREEKGLVSTEDPTLAALKTPQSEPAQYETSKADFSRADFEKVVSWLEAEALRRHPSPPKAKQEFTLQEAAHILGLTPGTLRAYHERGKITARDSGGRGFALVFRREALERYIAERRATDVCHRVALANTVLAGTMWHASEIERFSQHGHVEPLPRTHKRQHGAFAALVCEHKGQFLHPTAVTRRVAKAAEELVGLGGVTLDTLYHWTRQAVLKTKVPASFAPGKYRHTVSTAAGNQGAADEAISKALGHKTATTTKRHYITRQVPPKIPTFA